MKENTFGIRRWFSVVIAGLVGQFAWTIENMYLNRYVFYLTQSTDYIPVMVALSAIVATVTTLLMGALSDRIGRRKLFVAIGYILWGISILLFNVVKPENFTSATLANSLFLSGTMVIVLDCVMTFFGSTSNDAAFNAFVTDNTTNENRGKVESVISILPIVSMLVIFGGFNFLTTGKDPRWDIFFWIFGVLTFCCGIGMFFLLPKDICKPNKNEKYLISIFYGFRPFVVKKNVTLYLALVLFAVFNIAIQVFFPYFMVYIENNLKITGMTFTLCLGGIFLIAGIVTVIIGLFMDKIGKFVLLYPMLGVGILGCMILFLAPNIYGLCIGGCLLIISYMVLTAVISAIIRDYTPKDEAGSFQGVRMIFAVCIPMVTGPYIGEACYAFTAETYVNEYMQEVKLPNEFIFLGAAIVLALAFIPAVILMIHHKKEVKKLKEAETCSTLDKEWLCKKKIRFH